MEGSDTLEGFVRGGLAALGIEPDEVDMAVIAAADHIWGPAISALMSADLDGIEPEPDPDLSSAPSR
jgi:hypothetical protein